MSRRKRGPGADGAGFAATSRRLAGLFRHLRVSVAGSLALAVAGVLANLAGPLIWGRAIDAVLAGTGFDHVQNLLLTAAGLYVLGALAGFAQQYLQNSAIARVVQTLRDDVEEKLNRLPLRYLNGSPRGELLSRMTNDIDNIATSLTQTLTQVLFGLLTVVGVLVMMLGISPLLTLLALVTVPLTFVIGTVAAKRSQRLFDDQWRLTGELNAHIEESYSGHELVTVFDRAGAFRETFAHRNAEVREASRLAQFTSGLLAPLVLFIGNLGYVLLCVVGALRVVSGQLTLGGVVAFVQYSRQYSQPLGMLASMSSLFQSGIASAARVFALLDEPEEAPDRPGRLPAVRPRRIAFEQVSFGHGRELTIKGLDLVIEPGRTAAIVGASGAGKTTLMNLVMRFYDVGGGRILIDGEDIASVSREALRSEIGLVPQEPWLFSGTIRDNIVYGRPDATPEEIEQAARVCGVSHIVHALPHGYDTVVDSADERLSDGERQLICIARAFIADPAVLILDEATSAVDARTELLLQRATSRLREGRTCLVIAHRLSTIRDADVIVVLRDGRIVEQGTHAQLVRAGGEYHRLSRYQFHAPTAVPAPDQYSQR
ncbi:ATP-binding cassette subfamily B protein [Kitasatospora sp. SolWspMP-SS2h]|uniref:ABC transporter ATP-binding protein n=1 Tax=Kitasatospora sp. SolWspMP-SS2h TaxID=1305729 RepID=UPI000DBAB01B|nr:ABC transporter ATP-binding protein [Kitasatospora sp. SolWspMP-SS2h]RAJ43058.1 ATP-binding cassette subfamily B protein [Kitasatospora sp. SolWspMP-SS2h]